MAKQISQPQGWLICLVIPYQVEKDAKRGIFVTDESIFARIW
jgi:hypothetical protein